LKFLQRRLQHDINRLRIRHVAGHGENPHAELLGELLSRRLEVFHFSRSQDQIRARLRQPRGDKLSDSPASSGDESDPAVELEQIEQFHPDLLIRNKDDCKKGFVDAAAERGRIRAVSARRYLRRDPPPRMEPRTPRIISRPTEDPMVRATLFAAA